jgi:peptidoglycan/LPS O-acetylase OafA/YrhL
MPALHSTPASRHRFHLLDALRGIAAVLVAIGHSGYIAYRLGIRSHYLAVDFFFCLSGFVIASSYENRLRAGLRTRDFIAARIIRLYPVYFLGIVIGLVYEVSVVQSMGRLTLSGFLMAAFLIPNMGVIPTVFLFPLNIPSWSLFLEVFANIAYALLIKLRAAGVLPLSLLAIVSYVALAHGLSHGIRLADVGVINLHAQALLGLARVTASFALGVLTLRLFRAGARFHLSGRLLIFLPAAIVLTLVFVLASPLPIMQTNTFRLLSIAILFPAITCLGASANPSPRWTSTCVVLGELSYPLYLIHFSIVQLANSRYLLHFSSGAHRVISVFLVLFATAAAYLVAQKFDTPVRRFLTTAYSKATAPAA